MSENSNPTRLGGYRVIGRAATERRRRCYGPRFATRAAAEKERNRLRGDLAGGFFIVTSQERVEREQLADSWPEDHFMHYPDRKE